VWGLLALSPVHQRALFKSPIVIQDETLIQLVAAEELESQIVIPVEMPIR
jgi:hypothetical protein